MKKTLKVLLLAIITLVTAFTSIVYAATSAPSTITMGTGHTLSGYVNGTYFSTKVTSDGKYAYCTDINKKTPNGMKMTLVEAKDAGLTYIIENGYPNKSFTGNADKDYYITQSAVWWYLDETTGSSNLSSSFKSTGSDSYGLRKYIKQLVEDAKEAKTDGYVTPSVSLTASSTTFTMSSDRKYYYSDYITVKGTSTSGNITLSLSGAPSGSTIVNSNGTSVTSVTSGTKVRIKVLVSNVSNLETTITINATATGKIDKAYMYKPSNSSYQPVVIGVLFSETSSVSKSKSFTLKSAQVAITKVDSETGKALAGAKLQLKDSSGNVIDSWTSTTSAHTIKNLPEGTYKIIETEAPNGYKLNKTAQEVTLKAGVVTKVSFYNSKKEPTKVVIIKRDQETNETLAGAVFVLKNSAGEEVTTWTSTTNGHYVSGLPEGEYTIEELNAPKGYIKSDEIKKVTLVAGETVTVTFYNQKEEIPFESAVKITKVNGETGETLSGATLVLKDSSGEVVKTWVSTEEAYVIENLQPGTYFLSETEAPEGFVLSTEIVEIEITENGGTVIVTFYNTPEVEVPNTGSNTSLLAILLGIITIGIGGSIVYITFKKEV